MLLKQMSFPMHSVESRQDSHGHGAYDKVASATKESEAGTIGVTLLYRSKGVTLSLCGKFHSRVA